MRDKAIRFLEDSSHGNTAQLVHITYDKILHCVEFMCIDGLEKVEVMGLPLFSLD